MLNSILCNSKVKTGEKYNFTSLSGGCYNIERKDVDVLFDECRGFNLVEKPPETQMFVVDIDNKEKGEEIRHLYTESSLLNCIETIKETLRNYGVKGKLLDCAYLSKAPYLSKGYVKNGFHLAFPNLFIHKDLYKLIDVELERKVEGYDKMCGKMWLLYGCCKSEESGTYALEKVYTHDGGEVKPEDYFLDYKIKGLDGKQLSITRENVWKQMSRILCLNPLIFGRKSFRWNPPSSHIQKVFIPKYYENTREHDDEEVNENDESLEKVFSKLHDKRWIEWRYWWGLIQSIHAFGGSLSLALKMSQRAGKDYDKEETIKKYEELNHNFNVRIAKLTLLKYLREDCPEFDVTEYEWLKTSKPKETTGASDGVEKKELTKEEIRKKKKERDDALCKENLKTLTTITGHNIEYKSENDMVQRKYINPAIFDIACKLIFVISCLCSGKSFSVCDFIKKSFFEGIIVLTPRRSYARSAVKRLSKETGLDFKCYLDIRGRGTEDIDHPFIGIQIESLHRLNRDLYDEGKNFLVILDESEAILTQCTSSTNADRHMDNMSALHSILKNASKVVCLDAFMTNRTRDFFRDIGVGPPTIYKYTRKQDERKMILLPTYLALVENIKKCLREGKRCWIMFTSKKSLNQLLPILRNEFPKKVIKEYTGDKTSDNLENIEESWSEAHVVAYTATITVGLDYNIRGVFHKGFVYCNPASKNLIRDVFQGMLRVRHLVDNEVYCFLEEKTANCNTTATYPIDMNEIKKRMGESTFYKKLFLEKYDTKTREYSIPFSERMMPEWLKNLFYFNQLEWHMSITRMKDLFLEYCKVCNYKIETEVNIDIDTLEDLPLEIEFETPYDTIPTISTEIFRFIESKRKKGVEKLNDDEILMRKKYIFDKQIIPTTEIQKKSDIWDIFCTRGQKYRFNNLRTEKGLMGSDDRDKAYAFLLEKRDRQKYLELSGDTLQKAKLILEMVEELKLNSTCDYETVVTREILESYMEKMKVDEIKTVFKCRKRMKKESFKGKLGMINKMLEAWGMSQIKEHNKKRKMVKGKRKLVSDYKLVNKANTDIYEYLIPTVCE